MNLNDKVRMIADGEFEVVAKLTVDEITQICRDLRGSRYSLDVAEPERDQYKSLFNDQVNENREIYEQLESLRAQLAESAKALRGEIILCDSMRAQLKAAQEQKPALYVGACNKAEYYDHYDGPFGGDFYAAPVPTQQSPAVEVPDTELLASIIRKVDGKHSLGASVLAERIVEELKAPRITEQDAREIAISFYYYRTNQSKNTIESFKLWFYEEGRDLLNKLNGDENGK